MFFALVIFGDPQNTLECTEERGGTMREERIGVIFHAYGKFMKKKAKDQGFKK